jgi:hypothetical protein
MCAPNIFGNHLTANRLTTNIPNQHTINDDFVKYLFRRTRSVE